MVAGRLLAAARLGLIATDRYANRRAKG